MENYLIITRLRDSFGNGYKIRAKMSKDPEKYHSIKYYDYSRREAEKRYREFYHLTGKHLIKIEV